MSSVVRCPHSSNPNHTTPTAQEAHWTQRPPPKTAALILESVSFRSRAPDATCRINRHRSAHVRLVRDSPDHDHRRAVFDAAMKNDPSDEHVADPQLEHSCELRHSQRPTGSRHRRDHQVRRGHRPPAGGIRSRRCSRSATEPARTGELALHLRGPDQLPANSKDRLTLRDRRDRQRSDRSSTRTNQAPDEGCAPTSSTGTHIRSP